MFDMVTGWKISVESTENDGAYMIVPEHQVVEVCRLLNQHSIPHAIDGEVPSHHHATAPAELVVRMGIAVEVAQIQEILDLAP